MIFISIWLFLVFLCWGSFLNVVAYRIIFYEKFNLIKRSNCNSCKKTLQPLDLIPVFSFIFLKGKCRYCKSYINFLYPIIEIVSALLFTIVFYNYPLRFFPFYFIYISALLVNARTDAESMLLSRFFTLYMIPVALIFCMTEYSPIALTSSIIGSLLGYGSLWLIKKASFLILKKDAMGEGDLDLLAMIGAFTGPFGVYISVSLGTLTASMLGIFLIALKSINRDTRIPFGPFLIFGSILFVLFENQIIKFFL